MGTFKHGELYILHYLTLVNDKFGRIDKSEKSKVKGEVDTHASELNQAEGIWSLVTWTCGVIELDWPSSYGNIQQ